MAIRSADQITIVDVTDAYSVILTSEAYTFVGGVSGVASGAKCSTQAVAFCGTNKCPSVTVEQINIECPVGISAAVSGSGTNTVTIEFTTTATVSSACEATIPVTVNGITVNKKFSFAVAKTGATGSTGAAGKGVKSTAVTYQKSTSGTTAPTGTWGTSIPSLNAGEYLWTRTIITYTDNTTSTSYSIGMKGATGATGEKGDTGDAGKGISSTEIRYSVSSSGTTIPTASWSSTIPTATAGQFVWTRTKITYTDGTSSTSYSVGKIGNTGAKGDKGDTGDAGMDAITITITSSNGTVFKNSSGSTVLTANVYKSGQKLYIDSGTGQCFDTDAATPVGYIKWYEGSEETAMATAETITISASAITNAAVYTCKLEG